MRCDKEEGNERGIKGERYQRSAIARKRGVEEEGRRGTEGDGGRGREAGRGREKERTGEGGREGRRKVAGEYICRETNQQLQQQSLVRAVRHCLSD